MGKGKNYNRNEIIDRLKTGLKTPSTLYKPSENEYINYTGKTKDTKELYYDVIIRHLFSLSDNLDEYFRGKIKKISRKMRERDNKVYRVADHDLKKANQEAVKTEKTLQQMGERMLAKALLNNKTYPIIGKMIDYEIPINDENCDGAGSIDLLAYNSSTKTLSIIELKKFDNKETLLRTILEINTYYCQIDTEQLKLDYMDKYPTNENIKKVILVFKGQSQHTQYCISTFVQYLAKELQVTILLIDEEEIVKI